jgi:tetratricopeptide (TPR) repeat protein
VYLDERACELYRTDGASIRCGSGTLLNNGFVLTSAHGVGGIQEAMTVRLSSRPKPFDAVVAWRQQSARGVDAALVRIVDPEFTEPSGLPRLRWGRIVTDSPDIPCEAVGFPEANVDQSGVRDTYHLLGAIRALGRRKNQRIDLVVDDALQARIGSPWSGMSGAGLFVNGILVGVVTRDEAGFGAGKLSATPVTAFVDKPDVARLVRSNGGPPRLEPADLAPLQQPPAPVVSAGSLLRADVAAVAFRGRERTVSLLLRWCESEAGASAYLVAGPGGQGKTRLAAQLCDVLSRRGWATVDLRADARDSDLAALRSARGPLAVMIDYAEQRRAQLDAVAAVLAAHRKARVLMLARADGEWRRLLGPPAEFLSFAAVLHLDPLDSAAAERDHAFDEAVADLAVRLPEVPGHADVDWTAAANNIVRPALPEGMTALGVQLTALAKLLEAANQVLAPPGTLPIEVVARHEARYWAHLADAHGLALSAGTRQTAVAGTCLLHLPDAAAGASLLARTPGVRDLNEEQRQTAGAWLKALYPDERAWCGRPQPDALAEHVISTTVAAHPDLLDTLLGEATPDQARDALVMLANAAVDAADLQGAVTSLIARYPHAFAAAAADVAVQTAEPEPLIAGLHAALDADPSPEASEQIYAALPDQTVVLNDLAIECSKRFVAAQRDKVGSRTGLRRLLRTRAARTSDREARERLATALLALSGRLASSSNYVAAFAPAAEAVAHFRRLVATDHRYSFPLAAALNDMSNVLARVAKLPFFDVMEFRRSIQDVPRSIWHLYPRILFKAGGFQVEEYRAEMMAPALALTEEAVAISRRLAEAEPERMASNLAFTLTNLANRLSDAGRHDESLAVNDEATAIQRRLAEEDSEDNLPGLAKILNNRSAVLSNLGQYDAALRASQESVRIRRQLVAANRDSYVPGLAASLMNLALRFLDVGRPRDGRQPAEEAVQFYRALADMRQDAFEPRLHDALTILAKVLEAMGRKREAAKVRAEMSDSISAGVHLSKIWPPSET